jgi:hypothetical protein
MSEAALLGFRVSLPNRVHAEAVAFFTGLACRSTIALRNQVRMPSISVMHITRPTYFYFFKSAPITAVGHMQKVSLDVAVAGPALDEPDGAEPLTSGSTGPDRAYLRLWLVEVSCLGGQTEDEIPVVEPRAWVRVPSICHVTALNADAHVIAHDDGWGLTVQHQAAGTRQGDLNRPRSLYSTMHVEGPRAVCSIRTAPGPISSGWRHDVGESLP